KAAAPNTAHATKPHRKRLRMVPASRVASAGSLPGNRKIHWITRGRLRRLVRTWEQRRLRRRGRLHLRKQPVAMHIPIRRHSVRHSSRHIRPTLTWSAIVTSAKQRAATPKRLRCLLFPVPLSRYPATPGLTSERGRSSVVERQLPKLAARQSNQRAFRQIPVSCPY